jgi:hypothetical protein
MALISIHQNHFLFNQFKIGEKQVHTVRLEKNCVNLYKTILVEFIVSFWTFKIIKKILITCLFIDLLLFLLRS